MTREHMERWEDFPVGPNRLAAQIAIRDAEGVLAIRAAEPFRSRLERAGYCPSYEQRSAVFVVSRAAAFQALSHFPARCARWLREERPCWAAWYDRERGYHDERGRWDAVLAALSGARHIPLDMELRARVGPHLPDAPDLYDFQQLGVAWLRLAAGRAVLGDEMGLGKTVQALSYVETSEAQRVLVVAPASVTLNWAREGARWAPSLSFLAPTGGRALRAEVEGGLPEGRFGVVVSWGLLHRWRVLLESVGFDAVVADEAHRAKSREAKRTRALTALAHAARCRLLLTGTEARNGPSDLWSLLHIVDPIRFPVFEAFGERYCGARWQDRDGGGRVRTYRGAARLKELNAKLRPLVQKRLKKDVLPQLPEKVRQTIPVRPLRGRPMRDYRSAVRALRQASEEGELNKALGQLARIRREVGLAKVKPTLDWLRDPLDAGEQVVVFLEHTKVREKLEEGLVRARVPYGVIVGATPQGKRQGIVDEYQAGRTRVLIGSQACKEGVTLTAATVAVQLEYWWVPGDMGQAEDRIWRIGQTRGVLCVRMHLLESVDDFVAEVLRRKRRVLGALSSRDPITLEVLERLLEVP